MLLAGVGALAATMFFAGRADDGPEPRRAGAPAAVSPASLAPLSRSSDVPVYWAGRLPSRKLELTTTPTGTFVRYLPENVEVGDPQPALTIATYPLRRAYATATRRASDAGMVSRRRTGGLAVWSRSQTGSVYLAFPGVPYLVEVYAPTPQEARKFALSELIRPVR